MNVTKLHPKTIMSLFGAMDQATKWHVKKEIKIGSYRFILLDHTSMWPSDWGNDIHIYNGYSRKPILVASKYGRKYDPKVNYSNLPLSNQNYEDVLKAIFLLNNHRG